MTTFKSIRERLQLSQAALGRELGMTQGNVSFYEKGQTVPPAVAARLIAVAKAMGHVVTFNDIYEQPAASRRGRRRGRPVLDVAREAS